MLVAPPHNVRSCHDLKVGQQCMVEAGMRRGQGPPQFTRNRKRALVRIRCVNHETFFGRHCVGGQRIKCCLGIEEQVRSVLVTE